MHILARKGDAKLNERLFLCAGSSPAARYACAFLRSFGISTTACPSDAVTDLLLDVPSFQADGSLRFGGTPETLLQQLRPDVTVWGGGLNHTVLANHPTRDLLQDPYYLSENAYITAECALDVALPYLSVTLRGCPVLILGWGRIGKCLSQLLKSIGANVIVAARKETDLAMLRALGFEAVGIWELSGSIGQYRLIFNTVPAPILDSSVMAQCHNDCVKIDLASTQGMEAEDSIIARGLPGIHMPESSGLLIARAVLRICEKEE